MLPANNLKITEADIPLLFPLREIRTGASVQKPSAKPMDFAYGKTGTVMRQDDMAGVLWDGESRIYQYPLDTALAVLAPVDPVIRATTQAVVADPSPGVVLIEDSALEQKATSLVTERVNAAKVIVIETQEHLDSVSAQLIKNKKLQRHFSGERVDEDLRATGIPVFDWKSIKRSMDEAKDKVLAQEKAVMEPLKLEERLYKMAIDDFDRKQKAIAAERARQEQIAREAEEKRLLALAEEEAKRLEAEANALLAAEHEQEVERALESLPPDASAELVEAVSNTPAPEPIRIAVEIPVLPPAVISSPGFSMPKGIGRSLKPKYKGELASIALLCRAVADGKVSSTYVTANMAAINNRIKADGTAAQIPGVKVVEDRTLPSVRT